MKRTLLATVAALAFLPGASFACDITVGLVLELTGEAGAYGQAGAKSVEMAFRDLNDAGGVAGCTLKTDTRDSQTQANVAVDAATQLVQVAKVPAIIGGIISPMSIPILTSVTGPAKVLQVSPASSSPTLTALGREGKSQARPTDAQRYPHTVAMQAKLQTDKGKADYRKRKWIAEPPNGWIKSVLGFRQFSMRGLDKAKAEFRLVCLALNLRRMGAMQMA